MSIFCEICEVKKNTECTGHVTSSRLVQCRNQSRQFMFRLWRPSTSLARNLANLFDPFQSGWTGQFLDDITEHITKCSYIATQKFIIDCGQDISA